MDKPINIDSVGEEFLAHLEPKGNSRIFFSGAFGVGKTFFLKHFFEKRSDKYDVFHLYPVNYQIKDNSDIIDLLKYDILVELVKKGGDLTRKSKVNNFSDMCRALYLWGQDNKFEIFKTGLSFIPSLGRPLADTSGLLQSFSEFKKHLEDGEEGLVLSDIEKTKQMDVNETDILSSYLSKKISSRKDGKTSKESVLVLDDLDRLDPDHIFRILNIFSAFFEREDKNKFGFDKVILVADRKNIEKIFVHKYGSGTSFDGYIDKFFSYYPFEFDNRRAVLAAVDDMIIAIDVEDSEWADAFGRMGLIRSVLKNFFVRYVRKGDPNLRTLLKTAKMKSTALRKGFRTHDPFDRDVKPLMDVMVRFLLEIFKGKDQLVRVLEEVKQDAKDEGVYFSADLFSIRIIEGFGHQFYPDRKLELYGYSISRPNEKDNRLEVSGKKNTMLFYDLLIKYIASEKHIEDSNHPIVSKRF